MVELTRTLSLAELLWLISAMPGLYVWARNALAARAGLLAAKRMGVTDGRLVWARFSRLLTGLFATIESTFLFIGVVAATRPTPTGGQDVAIVQVAIAGALIACSIAISVLGHRWKQVDDQLVAYGRTRRNR